MQDNPGASPMEVAQLLEGEWRNMTEEEQARLTLPISN